MARTPEGGGTPSRERSAECNAFSTEEQCGSYVSCCWSPCLGDSTPAGPLELPVYRRPVVLVAVGGTLIILIVVARLCCRSKKSSSAGDDGKGGGSGEGGGQKRSGRGGEGADTAYESDSGWDTMTSLSARGVSARAVNPPADEETPRKAQAMKNPLWMIEQCIGHDDMDKIAKKYAAKYITTPRGHRGPKRGLMDTTREEEEAAAKRGAANVGGKSTGRLSSYQSGDSYSVYDTGESGRTTARTAASNGGVYASPRSWRGKIKLPNNGGPNVVRRNSARKSGRNLQNFELTPRGAQAATPRTHADEAPLSPRAGDRPAPTEAVAAGSKGATEAVSGGGAASRVGVRAGEGEGADAKPGPEAPATSATASQHEMAGVELLRGDSYSEGDSETESEMGAHGGSSSRRGGGGGDAGAAAAATASAPPAQARATSPPPGQHPSDTAL